MEWKKITAPLSDETISSLRCGDPCLITGRILTARDKAHDRIRQMLAEDEPLPFVLKGELLYYVGPTPAKEGMVIGAAGPTTSSRMDPFSEMVLSLGVKGMMGKGKRDQNTRELLVKHKAVYFSSIGGAGAYLNKRIKSSRVLAFEDMRPEAVFELYVEDFPAVVAIDIYGEDLYENRIQQ